MRIVDLVCFISVLLFSWSVYFFIKPLLLKRIWKKTDYKNFDEFYQYCVKRKKKGKVKPTYRFGFIVFTSVLTGIILLTIVVLIIYVTVLLGATEYKGLLKYKF